MLSKGFAMGGGILQLLACVSWLVRLLVIKKVTNDLETEVELMNSVIALIGVSIGVIALTPVVTKSTFFSDCFSNFLIFLGRIFSDFFVGIGVYQILLLVVAAILFFCAGIFENTLPKKIKSSYRFG